jgi:hypothetical protein
MLRSRASAAVHFCASACSTAAGTPTAEADMLHKRTWQGKEHGYQEYFRGQTDGRC